MRRIWTFWFWSAALFAAGTGLGGWLWSRIQFPFSNPEQVVGPSALNPFNDLAGFALFVGLPSLFWILFHFWTRGHFSPPPGRARPLPPKDADRAGRFRLLLWAGLALLALVIALNVPTYHASGPFDAFHEGESLGAAQSLAAHQAPYGDFFFFHGWFQDPGRSWAAFQLFGTSIGAQRTLESILKVLLWLLLAVFLARTFRQNPVWAFAALLSVAFFYVPFIFDGLVEPFLRSTDPAAVLDAFQKWRPWLEPFHWIILSGRDLLVLAFLAVVGRMGEFISRGPLKKEKARFFFAAAGLSLIPLLAMAYSVDRGIYLLGTGAFFSVLFYFLFSRKDARALYVWALAAGLLAGLLALGAAIQWNGGGFARYVFLDLPRYKMLTDKLAYPLGLGGGKFFLAAGLAALALFRWTQAWLSFPGPARDFFARYAVETALLFLGLFCFRNILERPDLDHLACDSLWLFLFFLFGLFRRGQSLKPGIFSRVFPRVILALALLTGGLGLVRLERQDLLEKNFPSCRTDRDFLDPQRLAAVDRLNAELKPGEPFFTWGVDASWYYLLHRACPTPYPCLWVAAPADFQRQVVQCLEVGKVRLVLKPGGDWVSNIDGISDEARFPIVSAYIRANYVFWQKAGTQEIWIRKGS